MAPKKNRKNGGSAAAATASKSGIVTRSQKSESGPVAEMTYYTTLNNDPAGRKSNNIQVISKSKLKSDPAHYAELVSILFSVFVKSLPISGFR